MLNEALPKIVTEMLPGPISKSVIERRERAVSYTHLTLPTT